MSEFMMLFRHVPQADYQPTPEEMEAGIKQWQDWIGGIAAQGKFKGTNQLSYEGNTLKPDGVITDGPYAELKEVIGGYALVEADSLDEAMEMAKGCPILFMGGHVEVRKIMKLDI